MKAPLGGKLYLMELLFIKKGRPFLWGIIGIKSEPGINSCNGADSFGCPPCFFTCAAELEFADGAVQSPVRVRFRDFIDRS